jgi:hypothetical protein
MTILNKTVNYTQNVPVNLGYNNPITDVGSINVQIQFRDKMGKFETSTIDGVSSTIYNPGSSFGTMTWAVTGSASVVNKHLNSLTWTPASYEAAAIEQDFLSIDRDPGDHRGEILIEYDGDPFVTPFTSFTVSAHPNLYIVTKTENTLSQNRIYGVLGTPYNGEMCLTPPVFDNVSIYSNTITIGSQTRRILDYAVVNPHGDLNLAYSITVNGSATYNGTISLVGQFLIAEPRFVTKPVGTFLSSSAKTQYIPLGTVAQDQNQLISVQLLMKRNINDPLFDGDYGQHRPSYIKDHSYGRFSTVFVGERQSEAYDSGEVRWSFYGTPEQCNTALSQVRYIQPAQTFCGTVTMTPRDFYLETRIVNGKSRIYHTRGYD